MYRNEKISVIVPSYGRTNTLQRAITSVLNQTLSSLEIIIVDDNADIKMANEINAIAESFGDDRIMVIHNEKNLGGALARNEGIKAASGEYISFLDDDDEILPEKLEKQLMLIKKSADKKLALVYCWDKAEDSEGNVLYTHQGTAHGCCVYEGMYDCIASTSLWLCKREAIVAVGMFTDTPCKQDSYVIVKLLLAGYSVDRVPEYLAIYRRDSGGGISTQGYQKRIQGEEKLRELCRCNYNKISEEQIKEIEYSFATRLTEHYLAAGRNSDALEHIRKVLLHPLKRKSLGCYKRCLRVMQKKLFSPHT